MNDITIADTDFASTPQLALRHNFSITGAYQDQERWPRLDLGYVTERVLLGAGVTLTISQVALWNWRLGPYFQALGLDLFHGNGTASEPAFLVMTNMALVQRTCLPPSLYAKSSAAVPRPPQLPGQQLAGRVAQSPDCVNSSSPAVPAMARCWPAMGMYRDTATVATDLDTYGKVVLAGYLLWGVNLYYLCETVMTEECAAQMGGPVGCFHSMFFAGPLRPPPPPPPSPPAAPPTTRTDGRSLLAPLLGGILGGTVLLGAIAALAVLARRARRPRVAGDKPTSLDDPESLGKAPDCNASDGSEDSLREGGAAAVPADTSPPSMPSSPQGARLGAEDLTSTNIPTPSSSGPVWQQLVSDLELVPVTPLTPIPPAIDLDVKLGSRAAGGEVELLPMTLGKGSFGRVVVGRYRGERVAVKLLRTGLALARGADAAWALEAAAAMQEAVAAAAMPPAPTPAAPAGEREQEGDGRGGGGADGGAAQGTVVGPPAGRAALPAGGGRGEGGGPVGGGGVCPEPLVAQLAAGKAGRTFGREVAVLARCQHPNVVRLLAASLQPSQPCLVMELMDTSLDRLLHGTTRGSAEACEQRRSGGTLLPLPKVLHIGMQVSRALSYLHPTILHRDLKPANVLISNPESDKPVVKLADFGLSRLQDTVLVTTHPEVGTGPYIAPEAFEPANHVITDRSDIYALGVILWEMLSGARPWEGTGLMQIAYAVTLRRERLPLSALPLERCPFKLRELITTCWDPVPARRPAAAEVAKSLALVQEAIQTQTTAGLASDGVMVEVEMLEGSY